MTTTEFSNEFDVLYNNITSNQAPGLNEYEKSVFLTKAQNQLINEYFNNRVDAFGGGFDGGQKRQYDFSSIIRVANLQFNNAQDISEKIDRRSYSYIFPEDYHLAINEILDDGQNQYVVIPINHLDYARLMSKPYNLPPKRQAWRLITGKAIVYKGITKTSDPMVYWYHNSNAPNDFKKISINYEKMTDDDITVEFDMGMGELLTSSNLQYHQNGFMSSFKIEDTNTFVWVKFTEVDTTLNLTIYSPDQIPWSFIDFVRDALNEDLSDPSVYTKIVNQPVAKALNVLNTFNGLYVNSEYAISSLDINLDTKYTAPVVEIIGKFSKVPNYQLRYIKTLNPIVLTDLNTYGEEVSINGVQNISQCELPEEAHQEILERAVTLAKIAWQGATATQVAQQQRERNRD